MRLKKTFFVILIMALAIPQSVRAYDFGYTYQGRTLYYNIVDGEAQVTYQNSSYPRYNNLSGALVIPSSVTNNGITYSVTSIGSFAFFWCNGLTSVTIPNSVISIGENAFCSCLNLTSVIIGDSVTTIGNEAFRACDGMTSLTIGNSVITIGNEAFSNCDALTSLTIPNSVVSIGVDAFFRCDGLTTVTIGNSVTSIGSGAFRFCSGLTEITCLGQMAPTLGSGVFSDVSSTIPVYIPCGSTASYQSGWNYFSNFVVFAPTFIFDVQSADTTMGEATITAQYSCASPASIEAAANYGYHFTQWNDGDTSNPRNITLTQDTSFTAFFAPNQYSLTVLSNDESLGSVDGGGTFNYLDTIEITATATDHYHFVCWEDGNRDNPRVIVIAGDTTLTAIFAIDTHTVAVASNDTAYGTVESSGTEFAYGTPCTVTATACSGYTFVGWSNGVIDNPYTFAVLDDVVLTALFMPDDSVGIHEIEGPNANVYSSQGHIVVDGANGNPVWIYDVTGRLLATKQDNFTPLSLDIPAKGIYLIKIGDYPARKVVVIR